MRKSFALFLIGIILFNLIPFPTAAADFEDVPSKHVHRDAIYYLQEKNVLSGYADGTFKPDRTINRAEFVKIIVFALLKTTPAVSSEKCFSDVDPSQWFHPFVCYAKNNNIISGYADGTFQPTRNISFAEASKIIVNAFGYSTSSDPIWYKPFVDKLSSEKAIPTTIESFEKEITRGEMSEIIFRIDAKVVDKASRSYDDFVGRETESVPSSETTSVSATVQSDSVYSKDPSVIEKRFPNGFTYFYKHHDRPQGSVSLELIVKAGSAYEEEGNYGVAHFLEHLAFNGTESFSAGEIFKYLSSIGASTGADANAYTSADRTSYTLKIPGTPDELEQGVKILSEFAGKIRFDSEEIKKELPIILEEMRKNVGREQRFTDKYLPTVFRKSTYQHSVIGLEKALYQFSQEYFLRFYKKWYRPDNMALVVVGDVQQATVDDIVGKYFSALPAATEPLSRDFLAEPDQDDMRFLFFTDEESAGGNLNMAFRLKNSNSGSDQDQKQGLAIRYALGALNTRFLDLYSAQEKEEISMGAGVSPDFNALYGFVNFVISYDSSNTVRPLPTFFREVERFRQHGITDAELKAAKQIYEKSLKSSLIEKGSLESSTYAERISDAFWKEDVILSVNQRSEMVSRLNAGINTDYVSQVIRDLFNNSNRIISVEMPRARLERVSENYLRDLLKNIANEKLEPTSGNIEAAEQVAVDGQGSIVSQSPLRSDLGMTRTVFENGLTLLTKKTDFEPDSVYLRVVVHGGDYFLPKGQQWFDNFLVEAMREGGTKSKTYPQLLNFLKQRQISFSFGSGSYEFDYSAHSTLENFDDLLGISREILLEPSFDDATLKKVRESLISNRNFQAWDPEDTLYRRRDQILYDNANRINLPTAEQINNYAKVHATDFHAKYFVPGNMELRMVGNMDEQKMIDAVSRYFGTLPKAEKPDFSQVIRDYKFPRGTPVEEMKIGSEQKATTLAVFKAIDDLHQDTVPWQVFVSVLDERLNDEIREKLGGTYSLSVDLNPFVFLKGGTLEITFDSGPTKHDDLFRAAFIVMHDLQQNGITEAELKRAVEPMKQDYQERFMNNDFWLSVGDEFNEVPYSIYHDRYKSLSLLTVSDINRVAKDLDLTNYFRLILLPDLLQ